MSVLPYMHILHNTLHALHLCRGLDASLLIIHPSVSKSRTERVKLVHCYKEKRNLKQADLVRCMYDVRCMFDVKISMHMT